MSKPPAIVGIVSALMDFADEINAQIFSMMNGTPPDRGTARSLTSKMQQIKSQARFQRVNWVKAVTAANQSEMEASIKEVAEMEGITKARLSQQPFADQ